MTKRLVAELGLDKLEPGTRTLRRDWSRLLQHSLDTLDRHGKMEQYLQAVRSHEPTGPRVVSLSSPIVSSRTAHSLNSAERRKLEQKLQCLSPWKKGPFELDGVGIDAEWRSDLKWERLRALVPSLDGRDVLDVGTGNGYFLLRALGDGARGVLGVEPAVHSVAQYLTVKRYFPRQPLALLPLTAEAFSQDCHAFDFVLSMGVLYHRRSPFDHLQQLRGFVREGGQLLLETLVVDGPLGHCLVPEGRYAQMRNVWFLPSRLTLESWLKKSKLRPIDWSEPVWTTPQEQRVTAWTGATSLADHLDPNDPSRTIEGHPGPRRLMVLCEIA